MTEKNNSEPPEDANEANTSLPPAASRALAEAQERREARQKQQSAKELGGRGGEDPTRFGDWEINGRAIDF